MLKTDVQRLPKHISPSSCLMYKNKIASSFTFHFHKKSNTLVKTCLGRLSDLHHCTYSQTSLYDEMPTPKFTF